MKKAAVIIIGNEILLGRVTDTNSGFIARTLDPYGISVDTIVTVGDDGAAIADAVRRLTATYPLVLTTGGLGPTKDDITKKVLCEIYGGTLRMDDAVLANVERVFAAKGLKMNELTRQQALVPTSCTVIQNTLGTAPIMEFRGADGHILVSLPGVPFETQGMLVNGGVAERIARELTPDVHTAHRTLLTYGITESGLAERLDSFENEMPATLRLAYLPDSPIIKLRLDAVGADSVSVNALVDEWFDRLRSQLGDLVFAIGEVSVEERLEQILRERGLTVGTAESCTGGNIAHRLTSVAGSSEVYNGSIVSYTNELKHTILGVSNESLEEYGAVSEAVVRQMAEGAARVLGTDCAIATSGIAGPGGGTPAKPVGTVWMAVTSPSGTVAECHRIPGNRARVIERATVTALLMLLKQL